MVTAIMLTNEQKPPLIMLYYFSYYINIDTLILPSGKMT